MVPNVYVLSPPFSPTLSGKGSVCHVFSTSDMKDGSLTFEDFLDLLSAFSDSATLEIKSHYAFRIFGNTIVGNSWGTHGVCHVFMMSGSVWVAGENKMGIVLSVQTLMTMALWMVGTWRSW